MAVEPSPTAAATRFIEPFRTSTAYTPGRVVSSRKETAAEASPDRCRSGADESPLITLDCFGEPARERLRTDQDEQAGGWYQFGLAGVAVPQQQLIEVPGAAAADDLAAVADVHIRRGFASDVAGLPYTIWVPNTHACW
jgi:hypothetical protein